MAGKGVEYPSVFVVDGQAGFPPLPPKPGQRLAQKRRRTVIQTMLFLLVSLALLGIVVEACFIFYLYKTRQGSESSEQLAQEQDRPQIEARKGEQVSAAPPKTRPPLVMMPSKPLAHLTGEVDQLQMSLQHKMFDYVLICGVSISLQVIKANTLPCFFVIAVNDKANQRPGADGVMPWINSEMPSVFELEFQEGKLVIQKEGYYYIYAKLCFFSDEAQFEYFVVRTTQRYMGVDPIELLRYRYHGKPSRNAGLMRNGYLGGVFHLYKKDQVFVLVRNGTVRLQTAADNFFGMFML